MSRDKKPNKPKKAKYTDPKTGAFRHTDGDRRHRLGASAKEAGNHKKRLREMGGLPPEVEGEADEWDEADEWADTDDTPEASEEGGEGGANA
jgi:hypothetical protein